MVYKKNGNYAMPVQRLRNIDNRQLNRVHTYILQSGVHGSGEMSRDVALSPKKAIHANLCYSDFVH